MTTVLIPDMTVPSVEVPTVAIEGDARRFPVRRIWCVGRNYADHAAEMGGDPEREPPFFFAKPADAVVSGGGRLSFPVATSNLHHEVELAVAIGATGTDLGVDAARSAIFGYGIALDMTRRDLQAKAKRQARPWDMAKGFDRSCPISALRPVSQTGFLQSGGLRLHVNGQLRQEANLTDMIWSVEECIVALSRLVEIKPGDILLTGTPAGVGPVMPGDTLLAQCDGVGELRVEYDSQTLPERKES